MNRAALTSIAVLMAIAPRLAAQAPRPDSGNKSPTAARVIGLIVPGAGHMYAGEVGHGFAYMGGTLGLFALTLGTAVTGCLSAGFDSHDCGSDDTPNVLAVATVGLWAWSIYDAGRAARRTNARRARKTSWIVDPGVTTLRGRQSRGTLRLGLRVATH